MKAALILLSLMGFTSCSEALQCFQCSNAASNFDCILKGFASCSSGMCYTSVASAGGSTTINKGCLNGATCTAGSVLGNINIGVASTSMQCCSTDFCNFNGSTTARVNLVLLGISILVIYFVGKTTI
ncbi:lymphocyte antigen 6E-like isoform X1 [Erpetoichthys calabaricus]|uniref:lymphocyte antigen 6E-like isoform X1 n=1 Tax=Erpetoichthys calabaricus TaxID=27687 RepID=UPI00109FE0F7|nr:lymphocyte antigen 6E-like isoform X1 [Erpetoichthys calabaricus]